MLGSELVHHLPGAGHIQESEGDVVALFQIGYLSTKPGMDTIRLQVADEKRVAEKGSHTFFAG